jgi:hypothetical protein
MLKIEITDGRGRKYRNLGEAIKPAFDGMIEETGKQVQRAIEAESCPEHHRRPRVTRRKTSSGFKYEYECCCDQLKSRADQAFRRALRS